MLQYEENAEIQDYFGHIVESMRQQATVFDVGSILIKPVQRILKYPLLLNELIKVTELSNTSTLLNDYLTTVTETSL